MVYYVAIKKKYIRFLPDYLEDFQQVRLDEKGKMARWVQYYLSFITQMTTNKTYLSSFLFFPPLYLNRII